ncbi:MAG: UDP-glucose/GDP-mannose dehydrogenase family protein [Ilumatobacteraceae bacterium]
MTSAPTHHVAVVGTGYVGLTTGAALASLGHRVVCADIDAERIDRLRQGHIPIVEEGLEAMVREQVSAERLSFASDSAVAVADADLVFLCVPTPSGPDGRSDLRYIKAASADIREALSTGAVVVNKSTVPVGSTKVVEGVLLRDDISVVSNPEFLREGTALHDFLHPDRIVIGADDRRAAEKVASLYASLDAPVLITDPASAETIKYAANAFLATKISFANAVAAMCEAVGADVADVIAGLGSDHRIGPDFLRPGPGWGGSCLPKDTRALVTIARDYGYDFALVRGVIAVNEEQRHRIVEKIRTATGGVLEGATIAVLGLTFKAHTDDLRDSPSVAVVSDLVDAGAKVRAYDPTVSAPLSASQLAAIRPVGMEMQLCDSALEACAGADAVAVLTEWPEFADVDLDRLAAVVADGTTVIDARNLLVPETVRAAGLNYVGIGRR